LIVSKLSFIALVLIVCFVDTVVTVAETDVRWREGADIQVG